MLNAKKKKTLLLLDDMSKFINLLSERFLQVCDLCCIQNKSRSKEKLCSRPQAFKNLTS